MIIISATIIQPYREMNHATSLKDTDNGGGENGKDSSNGDGTLGIFQISWTVGTSHDSWQKSIIEITLKNWFAYNF